MYCVFLLLLLLYVFLFNILLAHSVVEDGCLEVDRDLNRVCGRTLGPQGQKGAGLV